MVCLRKLCPYHCSCLEYSCILDRYIWCIAVTAPRIVDVVTRGSSRTVWLLDVLPDSRSVATGCDAVRGQDLSDMMSNRKLLVLTRNPPPAF